MAEAKLRTRDPDDNKEQRNVARKAERQATSIAGSQTLHISGQSRRSRAIPYALIAPAVIIIFTVFVYPILFGFETSLHEDRLTSPNRRPFVGFQNYADLFSSDSFRNALETSFIFVFGTITLGMLLALTFSVVLNKIWFGRRFFRGMSLAPWLISGIAVATIWRFLFLSDAGAVQIGLASVGIEVDTWLGHPTRALVVLILANVWYIVPFGTLILLAGLQTVDHEQLEAASVDGADALRTYWHVIIPAIGPQLGLTLVYFSFASWNAFDIVLSMTGGGPNRATEVVSVLLYREAFERLDFGLGAAIMIVLLLVNTLFSVFYLKIIPRAS